MFQNAKIYLVDDDQAICKSIRFLVESVGFQIETYNNPLTFLDQYSPSFSGCFLFDIRMPNMSGLQLQEELKHRGSHKPIIFLTGHGDIPMAVTAIKKGAFQFFTKPYNSQELLDCINEAIHQDLKITQKKNRDAVYLEKLNRLTPREAEVLEWVIKGKTSRTIGEELAISPKTVELHRNKLMEKMGVASSVELVGLIYKQRNS